MSYRTVYRPANLSDYRLGLWSARGRKRQDYLCLLCLEYVTVHRLASHHHILPKALYPEFAYCDWNGVCLHRHHHSPIVHTTWTSWQDYVQFFIKRLDELHGIRRPA